MPVFWLVRAGLAGRRASAALTLIQRTHWNCALQRATAHRMCAVPLRGLRPLLCTNLSVLVIEAFPLQYQRCQYLVYWSEHPAFAGFPGDGPVDEFDFALAPALQIQQ